LGPENDKKMRRESFSRQPRLDDVDRAAAIFIESDIILYFHDQNYSRIFEFPFIFGIFHSSLHKLARKAGKKLKKDKNIFAGHFSANFSSI